MAAKTPNVENLTDNLRLLKLDQMLLAATAIEPPMAGIMGPPFGQSNGATSWPV